MQEELHIVEEGAHLFWGLIILTCTAAGTYLLAGSFTTAHWHLSVRQIAALFLFVVSFTGIFKLSEPLYHFTFRFQDGILIIHIHKGNIDVETRRIKVDEITALKFVPDTPRSPQDALFDFSRTYHLLWKRETETTFQKLLSIESADIILKVDDIASIMRYIKRRAPDIQIPASQARYFNL